MKTAIYPGTFDPMTLGHMDIARRAAKLFDRVYVLVSEHDAKQTLFDIHERVAMAKTALQDLSNVEVCSHDGLTLDKAHELHACALIRGVRQIKDYEYELDQASCNAHINPDIETVVLFAKAQYAFISSSAVKQFAHYHQSLEGLVPLHIAQALEAKYR